ncbi:hypothetical protein FACS1894182_06690 [Bacteroidia bacterium]|nr:hypothetical protein FACS1894182_06690 [Bacteroidia bacterium]
MIDVILSPNARQTMDNYFENYIGSQSNNDMTKRAFNFSRILKCLSQIQTLDTYIIDERNFVSIEDICTIEYELTNSGTQVIIQNIYFENKNTNNITLTIYRYLD